MRIAIFGARGFIGSALSRTASAADELFLFNRPEVDVRKPETFAQKLKDIKPDAVINLSAIIGTLLSAASIRDMFETNVMGNLSVAYAARDAGARCFLYTSSTVVHGENRLGEHHGRFDAFMPKHPYSASKAAAEYSLQQFVRECPDMNLVTVRPPMVIGNGTEPTLPAISFVREVLSGKEIQIYGDGLHEREYVSDTDVALGIWKAITWGLAAEHGYHPFFLTGNRISMRLLAEKVVQKFGGKVTYIPKTVQTFSLTTDPVDSKNLLSWGVEDDLDAILALVGRSFSSGDANV